MSRPTVACSLCTRTIVPSTPMRVCSGCRKCAHADCDTDSLTGGSGENEYVCPTCRNSPLVADAMMTSAGSNSSEVSPASLPAHDETSGSAQPETNCTMDMNLSSRNSPLMALANLDSSFGDLFPLPHSTGQVPSLSLPMTTSASAASNVLHVSPDAFVDFGDLEDTRFSTRRERMEGKPPGRVNRGGGVKKPNWSRSMTPRTRSVGGVSEIAEITHSHRGKRGGRGGSKNGRGRRPRGGKTSAMLAMVNAAAAIRDADQDSMETDDTRHRIDDNDYVRTVVVACANDVYFLEKPVCLICGSIGKDMEGVMLTCATCAQSYHSYCVGLHGKLNMTLLRRGWRCLDCTVCEGCGNGHDESNLILCDECDVSYHIYCLHPPLSRIPHGSWRCKWCAACRRCGKQVASNSDIQSFEGLCETCYSLRKCPKCLRFYEIGEHLVKCHHCSRWLHGKCEELHNEEMLDAASENGFRCSVCRPQGNSNNDAFNILLCDSAMLNKSALDYIHGRYGGTLFRCPPYGDSYFEFPSYMFALKSYPFEEPVEDDELESPLFGMNVGMSGRGRGIRGVGPGRRMMKLGIGGFFVKVARHRLSNIEDDQPPEDDPLNQKPKVKRPRKPRRSQLEDNYPPVIQEGFFGMRPIEGRCLLDAVVDEPNLQYEVNKADLLSVKQREAVEVNEIDAEAMREGETLLGNITENDILGNMDDIDFDNIDLNELLMDDDEDDEDTSDNTAFGDKTGLLGDGIQLPLSAQASNIRAQPSYPVQQQLTRNVLGRPETLGVTPHYVRSMQMGAGYNQGGMHTQPSSRSSSQMGETVERVNQATEKWEEDEPLGDRATKAAVLYANINYPQWKQQYPEWSERVKHIHRMWRSLDANSRQEYVNKARINRANRVKQPRTKRMAASTTGVVRAIVGGSRFTQQPCDMSLYGRAEDGNLFASPQQPGGPSASNPHNAQAVTSPINRDVLENYSLLQKRSAELAKYQMAIETDLARMRKQKKNLTAKRRQLNKNNQQVDAYGQRIEIELNESDRFSLASLITAIPMLQKDLENCKRDIKLHSSNVRDFEVKNNIPPDLIPQLTPVVQPVSLQVNVARSPQVRPPGPVTPNMFSPNSIIRPPPAYSAYASSNSCRPSFQPQNPNIDGNLPVYHTGRNESESIHFCSGPPTPSSGRPASSSSTEWQHRGVRNTKKRKSDERTETKRSSLLGEISSESLTTDFERDIFYVVDHVIMQAVIMVDGAEAARKSGMLKRLLESQTQANKIYPSQRAFSGFDFANPPKPKKKRTQQKKLAVGASSEYDLLLERITTQLRLCPSLPRRALEPILRVDRYSYAMYGVTDLPHRNDKPMVIGKGFGAMQLAFMDDYYDRMFKCPVEEESLYVSMSDFCNDAKIALLCKMRSTSPCCAYKDGLEKVRTVSRASALVICRRSNSPPIRQFARLPEALTPQAPHRSAFFEKHAFPEEISITVAFDGPEGTDFEASFRMFLSLIGVQMPMKYEMDTPPQTPEPKKYESSEPVKIDARPKTEFTCRQCGVLTEQPVFRQPVRSLGICEHEKDEIALFCSMNCYYSLLANSKAVLSTEDLVRAEPVMNCTIQKAERFVDDETMVKLRQTSADNFARSLYLTKGQIEYPSGTNSPLSDGRFSLFEPDGKCANIQIIHARELSLTGDTVKQEHSEKKWKGQLWLQYDCSLIESFQRLAYQVRQRHIAIELQSTLRVRCTSNAEDKRCCVFCGGFGDGNLEVTGRLLNADANVWAHVNCALWSEEVHETTAGALMNVDDAIRRASMSICSICNLAGATMRCYKLNCDKLFHVPCARMTKGKFLKDKTFICELHDDYRPEMVLDRLDALRRIYVDREENQLIAKLYRSDDNKLILRVGSLTFIHIGQLLPEQLKTFHNADHIFPIGYSVKRLFWSPYSSTERIQYECTIGEKASVPEFVIAYDEGQKIHENSATDAWKRVFADIEKERQKSGEMLRLFATNLTGEALFGLTEAAISKMTESLPGVDQLPTYTFKHGGSPLMDLPLAVNPTGCARSEPLFRTLIKHKPGRNQLSASVRASLTQDGIRTGRTRGSSLLNLADSGSLRYLYNSSFDITVYARTDLGQIGNSYYSQYQKMKKEWRNSVYLARSKIQGLGLYATRDIDMNAMIIEYKGEIIRSEVGEMREKRYVAQNRGVYMFRIDDELIIDATMAGGPARYINHSCDPNCSTRLLASGTNGEDKKIIIIANRPISAGEELTYDYQFDIEDPADKIPCLCGAPNCQKWMN